MILFPGRYQWVFSSVTNWHLQIRWWNWKPTSCDVNTMDALIVSIQMILVGRIIHPAKPYMCSLLLENEPTSIYSHLTRNKKWKLWVGWHGSSCWLLCLCVLCFVFVLLQNNPVFLSVTIFHIYIYLLTLNKKQKMQIMGRVARVILLVVVSLCVVFCVLCFLQKQSGVL
jgi:hypothetical protein